jgi:hypothetical protein
MPSVHRMTLAAAAAVGLVLFSLGCGLVKTRVSLTNADNGRSLSVLVGDEIDITLQTIGPGSYGTPVISSGSIRFLGESSPGPQNPGGPRQLYRFEAVAAGRAEITISHEGGFPTPRDAFVVNLDVN